MMPKLISINISTLLLGPALFLLFNLSSLHSVGQDKKNKKEEISITSSFKPSIVKTGKLEFQAELPAKDTSAQSLVYPAVPIQFNTPMSSFIIKPLAFRSNEKPGAHDDAFVKLGFGNFNTPFASMGFTTSKIKEQFTGNIDYISSKGNLPDQQYARSSLGLAYKNTLADNKIVQLNAGYNRQGYRTYGFDHLRFNFPAPDLRQHFNNVHLGASFNQLTGEEGKVSLKPSIRADFLTASRDQSEFMLNLSIPMQYKINERLSAGIALDAQTAALKQNSLSTSNTLVQVPVSVSFNPENLSITGSVVPLLKGNEFTVVPNLHVAYALASTGVKFNAGVGNNLNINTLHKLYELNPFLLSPDSLTIFHQTDMYAGVEWRSAKGLQLKFKAGYTQFKDLPLFINNENSGREMRVLNESKLNAINLEAEVDYAFTPEMEFRSSLKIYAFDAQSTHSEAYGLLPLELKFGFFWKPIKGLTTSVNADLWRGALARSPGMPTKRLKDAADVNLAVDYKLNKKWALWTDFNNIANIQYQRWNQYDTFGFNFIVGLRYSFIKSK